MKIFKRIISLLFEPIKLSGNRDFSEKITKFFNQKSYFVYIIAALLCVVLFIFVYLQ